MDFALAVKGIVVQDDKLLILKRRENDPTRPATWDVPGGRLERGEHPFSGLLRELREETGLDVLITHPCGVHHFVRDDNQLITMLVFLCSPQHTNVVLSDEHSDFAWVDAQKAKDLLHENFSPDIDFIVQKLL